MNTLIKTLKAQHAAIQGVVIRMNVALEQRNAEVVQSALTELKTGLLAHLALEDAQLYPALNAEVDKQTSQNLMFLVRTFSTNIVQISEALGRFLLKYQGKPIDLDAFAKEWASVSQVLASRIRSEEETLYPLYQKLHP